LHGARLATVAFIFPATDQFNGLFHSQQSARLPQCENAV
jgi:hypothetical protein